MSTVYSFDPTTGLYIGPTEAFIDPLESVRKKDVQYLFPAYSVGNEPPTVPAGFVARVKKAEGRLTVENHEAEWELVEDHRKDKRYSTETGQLVEVKEVGPISEVAPNTTDKEPPAPTPGKHAVWNGSDWVLEDLPPPDAVSLLQFRLALHADGQLTQADQAVAAMTGVEGEVAQIEWEYAATVYRDSPLVAAIASALHLDAAQLDQLFRAAAALAQ
ncbi:MAG: hypothetical protein LBR05_01105 [Azoarcus sp.]|jgi:hypothetical protein|nr:hypothetical protein [Azoarcus sp.]